MVALIKYVILRAFENCVWHNLEFFLLHFSLHRQFNSIYRESNFPWNQVTRSAIS